MLLHKIEARGSRVTFCKKQLSQKGKGDIAEVEKKRLRLSLLGRRIRSAGLSR